MRQINQSFNPLIKQVVTGFTGRDWLFDQIDHFDSTYRNNGGYIVITGLPGQGKTAVAARLAIDKNAVRHF